MPWSESSGYRHDEVEASEDLDSFLEFNDNSANEIRNDNHEKDTEMDHYHSTKSFMQQTSSFQEYSLKNVLIGLKCKLEF